MKLTVIFLQCDEQCNGANCPLLPRNKGVNMNTERYVRYARWVLGAILVSVVMYMAIAVLAFVGAVSSARAEPFQNTNANPYGFARIGVVDSPGREGVVFIATKGALRAKIIDRQQVDAFVGVWFNQPVYGTIDSVVIRTRLNCANKTFRVMSTETFFADVTRPSKFSKETTTYDSYGPSSVGGMIATFVCSGKKPIVPML